MDWLYAARLWNRPSLGAIDLLGRGVAIGLRTRFRRHRGRNVRLEVAEHALGGAKLHERAAGAVYGQGDWAERHVLTSRGPYTRYARELWIGPRRELRKAAYPSA